jgi:UDP-2,3-diacylglucosamine hydrolase
MKLVFISDLHLSAKTHNSNQLFYNLMEKWRAELDGLYILGDFFDFWCGDDDDNEFIREIKASLRAFTRHKPIYFRGGNHDFAIGKKFALDTGITLIPDMSVLKVGSNTILLSHGDTFCTLDISYQRLKMVLQNPLTIFILRRLPLSWRYKIKDKLEHKSGESFNSKPDSTYHVVDATVVKFATQHKANVVIHGHTHRPSLYQIKTPTGIISRFEIPDWADRLPGGYIILNDNKIEIHST